MNFVFAHSVTGVLFVIYFTPSILGAKNSSASVEEVATFLGDDYQCASV